MVQWRTIQFIMYFLVVLTGIVVLGLVHEFRRQGATFYDKVTMYVEERFGGENASPTISPLQQPGVPAALPQYPLLSIPRDVQSVFAPAA